MEIISETEFVKDAGKILDRRVSVGNGIVITRKDRVIATVIPFPRKMTDIEVMSDIHGILSDDAGKDRLEDSRLANSLTEIENVWDS